MKWRKLTVPAESGGTMGSLPGEGTGPLCRRAPGGSRSSVTRDASPQPGPPVAADARLPAGVLPGPDVLPGPGTPHDSQVIEAL